MSETVYNTAASEGERTIIESRHLNLYYGDNHALKDINIEIPANQITALIGPSGCGKSTFLKTLNRMNDLVEGCRITGRVLLDGEDVYGDMDVNLLRRRVGEALAVDVVSGPDFPEDLSGYNLIIHCGACMLNEREMQYRIKCAADQNIPFTNYGITIAYINGILKRTVEPFPQIYKLLDK